MNRLNGQIVIAAILTLANVNSVYATLFGITWTTDNDQSLAYTIDELTGNVQLIGQTGEAKLNALSEDGGGGFWAAGQQSIYSIDPHSGLVTSEVSFEFSTTALFEPNIRSLAAGTDGTLYALTKNTLGEDGPVELWSLDPATAIAALIAVDPGYSPQSLTLAPDGRLFAYSWDNGTSGDIDAGLISIDPLTGAFTDINLSVSSQNLNIQSMTFDPFGNLYAVSTSAFYSIDPTTGVAIFIEEMPLNMRGIAYLAPVPLPSALLLFASGISGLVLRKKARTKAL